MAQSVDWRMEHLRMALDVSQVEIEELVLPEEVNVLANGMRLHYLDWGGPGRRSVLLLHGGGLTAHTWDLFCLALRPRFHCYALDLRGHGNSEWSPNMQYGLDAYVADVEDVTKSLGLQDFILVGMSLGGLTALAFSARHPELLKLLVLVDVGPTVQPAGAKRIRDFILESDELDSVDDFVEQALRFNPYRDPQLLRRSLLHNLHQLPNGKWTWKYDRRHRKQHEVDRTDSNRRDELWNEVHNISCPTVVVRGERSDVFTDEDAEQLTAVLPDARWIKVAKAGHTVQGDNPKGLLEGLEPFLAPLA
jgi:pimeloyl-ACP methyl ester carboxylesterase